MLFSVHLKATMMKVSDPIIFGHVVKAFLPGLFEQYGDELAAAGLSPNNGLGAILAGLDELPNGAEIKAAIEQGLADGPPLAMVDSDKGITNLHVPSDVIVDASMPAMIRTSGHMWGPDGKEADTLAVIPDSSYAGIYQVVIDDCRANGAFDPTTMGSVPNVGLMAQAAEEYGSHDKTFEIASGRHRAGRRPDGSVLIEHDVQPGDIWRACQTKDVPIRDWVKLAVDPRPRLADPRGVLARREPRARRQPHRQGQGLPARARHRRPADRDHVAPARRRRSRWSASARARTPSRSPATCCATTSPTCSRSSSSAPSAKMLSIVPLINGGGLFETGAGGSAPKHVQQLVKENHLRWDSLGEFLALAASFEHLATTTGNARAQILADTLDRATGTFLDENKSPSRKVGEIDNRGSHFYLALYWAQELAASRPRTPSWPPRSPRSPARWPPTRRRSSTSCSPCRARPSTSVATTGPTTPRPRRSCARRRRSPKS